MSCVLIGLFKPEVCKGDNSTEYTQRNRLSGVAGESRNRESKQSLRFVQLFYCVSIINHQIISIVNHDYFFEYDWQ